MAHENGLTERARIEADARIEQAKINAGNAPIIMLTIGVVAVLSIGAIVVVELRKHPSQAQTTAIVYVQQPYQQNAYEYRPSWQLPGETEPQEIVIHRKQRA